MRLRRSLSLMFGAALGLIHQGAHGQTLPAFRKDAEIIFMSPDGAVRARIDVEIAESAQDRMQGLMFRERLEADQGMLFVFPAAAPLSFWMKGTPLPLDILFVDSERAIVAIRENTQPYSEEPVRSGVPARYVVEVNAGFADRHGLSPGDRVFWQRF
jgi:uncharacterized protein